MEKTTETAKKNNGHGGARKGAGRPKGSRNAVTIENLLEIVEKKSKGKIYAWFTVEDW